MFGDQAVAGFVKDGIDVDHVVRDKAAPSGVALIFVARDGENSIAVASGANGRLSPADVKKARKRDRLGRRRGDAARNAAGHGAGRGRDRGESRRARHPQSRARPAVARRAAPTGFDLDPQRDRGRVADRHQGRRRGVGRAGCRPAAGARRADRDHHAGTSRGLRGDRRVAEAHPRVSRCRPVDTTAAGDVFNGALAVALAEGQTLEQAVRFANAAAAISVTRMGAQPSAPKRKEIDQLAGSTRVVSRLHGADFSQLSGRLTGKLDQGLEHARLLLGAENQVRVRAAGGLLESARSIRGDRDPAAWRNVEVAPIAQHGEEHGGQVPGRPVVRRRDVADVGLGQRMVRHVAVIALDARGGVGEGDADLEAAEDHRGRPVARPASGSSGCPGRRCIPRTSRSRRSA